MWAGLLLVRHGPRLHWPQETTSDYTGCMCRLVGEEGAGGSSGLLRAGRSIGL